MDHGPIFRKDVSEYVIHPDFGPGSLFSDLAIIKLKKKLKLGQTFIPICINDVPIEILNGTGGYGRVIGYGAIYPNGTGSVPRAKILNDAKIASKCRAYDVPSAFCATSSSGILCSGDSGSPFFKEEENGIYTLIGILSGTKAGSCKVNQQVTFTNLQYFINFIQKIVCKTF